MLVGATFPRSLRVCLSVSRTGTRFPQEKSMSGNILLDVMVVASQVELQSKSWDPFCFQLEPLSSYHWQVLIARLWRKSITSVRLGSGALG